MFRVGDLVVGKKTASDMYFFTSHGCKGAVVEAEENQITVKLYQLGEKHSYAKCDIFENHEYEVSPCYFELLALNKGKGENKNG